MSELHFIRPIPGKLIDGTDENPNVPIQDPEYYFGFLDELSADTIVMDAARLIYLSRDWFGEGAAMSLLCLMPPNNIELSHADSVHEVNLGEGWKVKRGREDEVAAERVIMPLHATSLFFVMQCVDRELLCTGVLTTELENLVEGTPTHVMTATTLLPFDGKAVVRVRYL